MGTLVGTLEQTQKAHAEAERQARMVKAHLEEATAKAERAARNGHSTAAGHRQTAEALSEFLPAAEAAERLWATQAAEAAQALRVVRAARNAERVQAIEDLLGVTPDGNLMIDADWSDLRGHDLTGRNRFEIRELEMNADGTRTMKTGTDRNNQPFSYCERRFGFEVTVYGPSQTWKGEWEAATVNWGTLGSLSVKDARDMLRIHELGICLAEYLDQQRDEWVAEDAAD